MGHVNALGGELARGTLCNRAQPGFGCREGGESFASTQRGGCAGEQNRAAAARTHHARGFASREEACETGHLPNFGENSRGRLNEAEAYIRADVEDHDFERPIRASMS